MMLFVVASCRSLERTLTCNEITNYQIDMTEGYFYRRGHCYKAPLNVNAWENQGDLVEVDLYECDGIHGVKVTFAIAEIKPKFTALQRLREESCAPKK
jgi:hypothetical protein